MAEPKENEFLDDIDVQWLFWQREFELKMRLEEDWRGKDYNQGNKTSGSSEPTSCDAGAVKFKFHLNKILYLLGPSFQITCITSFLVL